MLHSYPTYLQSEMIDIADHLALLSVINGMTALPDSFMDLSENSIAKSTIRAACTSRMGTSTFVIFVEATALSSRESITKKIICF
jgi:hypothetical protein